MLLHAVIIPPPAVLAAVVHVLQSIEVPATPAPAPARAPKRLLRRRSTEVAPPPSITTDPELGLVTTAQLSLPIAGFGSVTSGDAAKLVAAMTAAAAQWACPTVHFAGGGALEFPDDRSVWAKLAGDVAGLEAVAQGVVQSVASRGFFVDRCKFRPWLSVATITDSTTAPYLERVVAALDAFHGEPWTVECVSVTKPSFESAASAPQEVYRIPLAPN